MALPLLAMTTAVVVIQGPEKEGNCRQRNKDTGFNVGMNNL